MSLDLVLQGMMVLLDTTIAVEFLYLVGVLGCGQTIFMTVWRRGTISLSQMKSPASSSWEDEDMKILTICAIVRTSPLMFELGEFSDNRMCAPD